MKIPILRYHWLFKPSINLQIRKESVRNLPTICQDTKMYSQRIADVLIQLLQSGRDKGMIEHSLEIQEEFDVVKLSCFRMMKNYAQGTRQKY